MRTVNPFHRLAGGRALLYGLGFIVLSALVLRHAGMVQDTLFHFTYSRQPFGTVLLFQTIWWLLPLLLLTAAAPLAGSHRFRLIDLAGTTAFSQVAVLAAALLMLPGNASGALPRVGPDTTVAQMQQMLSGENLALLLLFGLAALGCLILYLWLQYLAFSVSCGVRGSRAIGVYAAVLFVATVCSNLLAAPLFNLFT